jgi:hypothetical protein
MGDDLDDVYSLARRYGRRISKRPDDRFDIIGSGTPVGERGLTAEAAHRAAHGAWADLPPPARGSWQVTNPSDTRQKRPQLMGQGLNRRMGEGLGGWGTPPDVRSQRPDWPIGSAAPAEAFEWYAEPRHRQGDMIVLTGLAVAAVIVWLIGRTFREARLLREHHGRLGQAPRF